MLTDPNCQSAEIHKKVKIIKEKKKATKHQETRSSQNRKQARGSHTNPTLCACAVIQGKRPTRAPPHHYHKLPAASRLTCFNMVKPTLTVRCTAYQLASKTYISIACPRAFQMGQWVGLPAQPAIFQKSLPLGKPGKTPLPWPQPPWGARCVGPLGPTLDPRQSRSPSLTHPFLRIG